MCRLVPVIAWLVCGCGDGSEPAGAEASAGAEQAASKPTTSEPGPLPAPFEATFSLRVRIPLSAIAAQIDAQLPAHEAKGMEPLTREGQSPALEASYDIWRDPVTLRYADDALHVDVPVRYAARFNARVKSPFGGWLNIAKDEPWGTKKAPQRITLRVHTRVKLNARWELKLRSGIDAPEHGPPPDGKLCTGGSFKLCVAKSSVAPEVRQRLDAEIMPRMKQALGEVDQRLQGAVAIRSRLEQAWQALAQPRRLGDGDRWVVFEPRQVGLVLYQDGDALVVEPVVSARVSYYEGQPQVPATPPFPDRSPLSDLPGERVPLPAELIPPELRPWLQLLSP